jgi:hypothetical protein
MLRGMCRRHGIAVFAALIVALGCASISLEPQRLLDQGRIELDQQNLEAAYAALTRIRREYPRSPQSAEAFPLATRAFQGLHSRMRNTHPDSPWIPEQTQFMFAWLETYFVGDGFPMLQFEALFHGMPRAFLGDYQAFAATRPRLARWSVEVTDDNGLIDEISVHPDGSAEGLIQLRADLRRQ